MAVSKSLLALGGILATVLAPQAARADFIYGIGDDNIIYQVETTSKTIAPIFNTRLSGLSNAFAYDAVRKQFFFVDAGSNLKFWDGGASLFNVATPAQVCSPAGPNCTIPANAVYYNNSYWYFTEGTATLNQIQLNYAIPTAPTYSTKSTFTVAGISNPGANQFGDIAVNSSGILYGATTGGTFFSLNLANPSTTYTQIKPSLANPGTNPSLQLSFSADFNTLFAQNFAGGQWFTINLATGAATPISGFLTPITSGGNALRDLGGAGAVPIQTPAPLPLAGIAAGFAWSRRLRKRIMRHQRHG